MTIPTLPGQHTLQDEYAVALQDLWPRYLAALDRYTVAQADIARIYSSATFSLARANFSNRNRTHYGETYFDQRMNATTRATIIDEAGQAQPKVQVDSSLMPCRPEPPKNDGDNVGGATAEDSNALPKLDDAPSIVKGDPLRWFGVLVPPALRKSQAEFLQLSTGPVPQAVMAAAEMRDLDREIRRLRKAKRKAPKAHTVQGRDV